MDSLPDENYHNQLLRPTQVDPRHDEFFVFSRHLDPLIEGVLIGLILVFLLAVIVRVGIQFFVGV